MLGIAASTRARRIREITAFVTCKKRADGRCLGMIELVISQRRRDLGGFEVGRVLPFAKRRMVGPFIFFDHMGPVDFPPGVPRTVDVRPHLTSGYRRSPISSRAKSCTGTASPGTADPPRRSELDDRRARHHASGALRARAARGRAHGRHPGLDRAPEGEGRDRPGVLASWGVGSARLRRAWKIHPPHRRRGLRRKVTGAGIRRSSISTASFRGTQSSTSAPNILNGLLTWLGWCRRPAAGASRQGRCLSLARGAKRRCALLPRRPSCCSAASRGG